MTAAPLPVTSDCTPLDDGLVAGRVVPLAFLLLAADLTPLAPGLETVGSAPPLTGMTSAVASAELEPVSCCSRGGPGGCILDALLVTTVASG